MTDKELRSGEAAIVQKQADDALRDAAWRLESIIEGTHVGTWEWNVQTGETVYNEVWAQIIGYTLDELAPISIKTFQTFVHPDDLKQSDELLDRHFAGELPYYDYDCRMKHKDGHWVWVHDRGRVITRTGDGKPLMMFGTHTDITARKRAEEALVSSLSLLKATMESTADGILVVDLNGRITLWNHKFADMWRIPEELLSDHLDETALNYVLQELAQPEAFLAKVRELYGQPEESSNDQLDLADGRIFQRHSQPQRISDEVVGRVWSFSDITERKRAEDALRESEIKYRTLIEMTGTGYLILDSQGRVLDANQEYVRLSGHTRLHDILGKSVIAWTAEGAKQRNAEAIAQCARNGFIRDFVTEYVDGSGKITPVEINASVDGEGESSRIVSLCRDISERKQAEEEAQRERAFFDRLVETTPEGVAITDIQGRVMRVNAEFVRMFGYEVDEAVGQRIDDLVAPPERWEEASMITRSTGQGEKTLLETVRRRKDGTLVDVSVIAAPILIAGNQEACYAIYRDITERKRAEAQLRQSQKMEAIGTLAGGVAHDFNNLLTGILGNIALMRSSLPPTDPLLENLTAAETSARQAADLTKGLLTFSHSAMVLPVPMSITTALDATLALLKQSLPATMEIVRDYEEKAWNILLDQSQVTQILLNLAVNARDAMKGKGTLTVRVRNEVVGEEYLQAHPFARAGEFVHLSVTDTGPGMSSEVMLHLFEPFYTTKPIGSGTGLGLSVVYGAVKQA
ncbi:MAG: PAS domain S-box protein [Caldiserica bacterium]|nr:PAS domain S-box protein [Caldisericota bacterium]